MAWTINNGKLYFNTKLYTGNAGTQSITGVGFSPDFIWGKNRSSVTNHALVDTVRGNTKYVKSSTNAAEATITNMVTAFGSDGFSLGADSDMNGSSANQVAWNWKAGTTSIPSGGSLAPTAVSINATSGFGIYKYTGNGAGVRTIAHGLGVIPKMIIVKKLDGAIDWAVYHASLPLSNNLELNNTDAAVANNLWWSSRPTSSLIHFNGDNQVNGNGSTYVAYVFADVQGYSKFGSYTGNGNADGTFVYTGFSPAFVMVKRTNGANSWNIKDNRRNNASTSFNINPRNATLLPNDSAADQDANALDFLSNGFKNRSTGNDVNNASGSYIYMAFAENPFTSSAGTPVTAR